jgi:hypothetical protein
MIPSSALSVATLAEKWRLVNTVVVLGRMVGRLAFLNVPRTGHSCLTLYRTVHPGDWKALWFEHHGLGVNPLVSAPLVSPSLD